MNETENTPATADALRRELIAKRLAGRKSAAAGGAVGGRMELVERVGALPVSFAQERLWLLDRLSATGDEYILKYVWRVRVRWTGWPGSRPWTTWSPGTRSCAPR
ncbi:hypothetical protein GXW82_10070 [Streptacidiphilus sp. 4-A2]|nr:hypothetical protein [Streptacidiphilus sp. 4-A2]